MFAHVKILNALLLGLFLSGWDTCLGADSSNDVPDIEKHYSHLAFVKFTEENPEAALDIVKWNIENDRYAYFFLDKTKNIFRSWVQKDVTSAAAWLDRQLSAYLSTEKWSLSMRRHIEYHREQLESIVLGSLPISDLTAINARLARLNDALKKNLLCKSEYWTPQEEKEPVRLKLARLHLDDKTRLGFFSDKGKMALYQGFPAADAYLNAFELTADEKLEFIQSAAAASIEYRMCAFTKINSQQVKAMREWLISKGMGNTADRLTGENIARAVFPKENMNISEPEKHCTTFAEASSLAIEYWQSTGNDDVLIGFLERSNPQEESSKAIELAEKITDKEIKEKLIQKIQSHYKAHQYANPDKFGATDF